MFNAARMSAGGRGVLIGVAGVGVCFFVNGVSYVAVIAGLLAMRLPPFATRPMPTTAWEGVRQAVAFIRGDTRVWVLVMLVAVFSVLGFPFIRAHAGGGAGRPAHRRARLRTAEAAVGIGAMLGALGRRQRPRVRKVRRCWAAARRSACWWRCSRPRVPSVWLWRSWPWPAAR